MTWRKTRFSTTQYAYLCVLMRYLILDWRKNARMKWKWSQIVIQEDKMKREKDSSDEEARESWRKLNFTPGNLKLDSFLRNKHLLEWQVNVHIEWHKKRLTIPHHQQWKSFAYELRIKVKPCFMTWYLRNCHGKGNAYFCANRLPEWISFRRWATHHHGKMLKHLETFFF